MGLVSLNMDSYFHAYLDTCCLSTTIIVVVEIVVEIVEVVMNQYINCSFKQKFYLRYVVLVFSFGGPMLDDRLRE